jgi:hypothetical protein
MWFSKCFKLSKRQYEEARNSDSFKVHTKEEWQEILRSLEGIKYKYDSRDCIEKKLWYVYNVTWYPKDEQPNETWMYFRVSNMVAYIGDGWGKDYEREEILYDIPSKTISSFDDDYSVNELENGDLLAKHSTPRMKMKTKKITETTYKRYDCGRWSKRSIITKYKKQLIDDEDYVVLKIAEKYCEDFEKEYGDAVDLIKGNKYGNTED